MFLSAFLSAFSLTFVPILSAFSSADVSSFSVFSAPLWATSWTAESFFSAFCCRRMAASPAFSVPSLASSPAPPALSSRTLAIFWVALAALPTTSATTPEAAVSLDWAKLARCSASLASSCVTFSRRDSALPAFFSAFFRAFLAFLSPVFAAESIKAVRCSTSAESFSATLRIFSSRLAAFFVAFFSSFSCSLAAFLAFFF